MRRKKVARPTGHLRGGGREEREKKELLDLAT